MGEDFPRGQSRNEENDVDFVTPGIADESARIKGRVVAPRAADGGLQASGNMRGQRPQEPIRPGQLSPPQRAINRPATTLIGDGERRLSAASFVNQLDNPFTRVGQRLLAQYVDIPFA